MEPSFWQLLNDPKVKTIFVTGCGGGFDFVHSMTLIPQLLEAAATKPGATPKRILIGSYSFGDPDLIQGSEVVWQSAAGGTDEMTPKVRVVDSSCIASRSYGPEVGMCKYLDKHYPLGPDGLATPVDLLDDINEENPAQTAGGGGGGEDNSTTTPRGQTIAGGGGDAATKGNNGEGKPGWKIFAYYARAFTVVSLTDWLVRVCNEYQVDAIIAMDGGSDSLMRGDEAGLGDPIEDAVTVTAIAHLHKYLATNSGAVAPAAGGGGGSGSATTLNGFSQFRGTVAEYGKEGKKKFPPVALKNDPAHDPRPVLLCPLQARVLVAIGVGCDRFNGVSDAATLRAMSELSACTDEDAHSDIILGGKRVLRAGGTGKERCGFLGAMALEPTGTGAVVYNDLIRFLQSEASFASVIANSICETCKGSGHFGAEFVPEALRANRVRPGELFLWPFMSYHFAFHIPALVERSFLCNRLTKATSIRAMFAEYHEMRDEMVKRKTLRKEENLTMS